MNVSMKTCKKKLTLLWFIGSGLLFISVITQSFGGYYGDKVDAAWSWFLPTIMPTLSLILAVMVIDSSGRGITKLNVDRFTYSFTFILSLLYLIAIAVIIFISGFLTYNVFELMKISNYWLGPFQGLVSAALGIFFIKKE